jgi:potassium/hydrogen antiporter
VTMVTRDGKGFVPDRGTRLKAGDALLIVATEDVRDETADRLAAVSHRGLLARWIPQRARPLRRHLFGHHRRQ